MRVTVLLVGLPLLAQTQRQTDIAQEMVDKMAVPPAGFAGAMRPDAVTGTSPIDGLIAAWLLDRRGRSEELLTWMERRTDIQMSANPAVAASSSAAIKGGAARVLSVAVDMGMLNRTTNGQFVTFRGTPAGMAEAMFGWKVLHRPWDRLTGATTFDTNRGTTPGVLEASGRQLASWSLGLQVYNARLPASADWLKLAQGGGNYVRAREALVAAFSQWTELRDWQSDFATRVEREVDRPLGRGWISPQDAERMAAQIARDELELLGRITLSAPVGQALEEYARTLEQQLQGRDALRNAPRRGPIVALDWTVLRPANTPAQWAGTAIAQTNVGRSGVDLTANLTMRSTGVAQAALEFAVPTKNGIGSLSARYVRERWNRGPADVSVQGSWTVLLGGGIRVPISIGLTQGPALNGGANGLVPHLSIGVQYAADQTMIH